VLRTVIHDGWKYVAAQKWLKAEERPSLDKEWEIRLNWTLDDRVNIWGPVVHEELYDLRNDPGEKKNLSASQKSTLLKLKKRLSAYSDSCRQPEPDRPEKRRAKKSLTPEEKKRMKALGYL
jgi:hypothetical protein